MKKILLLMGALLITLCGCSSNPAPEGKIYPMNTPAAEFDNEFTATSVKCGITQIGDAASRDFANGQFCVLGLSVRNTGPLPSNFLGDQLTLYDDKNNVYGPDAGAWIYSTGQTEINSGKIAIYTIPFDIPKKRNPKYLVAKADFYGAAGVIIELKE